MTNFEGELADIGAEQAALGSMMQARGAIVALVELVRADDFYRPAHQTIFTVIVDLSDQGKPVDPISVGDELRRRRQLTTVGGGNYLLDLMQAVPLAANAAYYGELVAEMAQCRRLVEAGVRLAQRAAEGSRTPDELLRSHRADLDMVMPVSQDGSARTLVPVLASSIKPRRVRWLWYRRIVQGGLSLFAGREGLGKSTLAGDLAAQVTQGLLDGEFKGKPRHVIYITSEDAREFTVVPRMIAAGADMDRILFVDVHHGKSTESPVVLPLDLDALADLIDEYNAALVVLDAATSVMDGRLDGDRDRQMRQALEPVSKMAERTDCAVLGIVHFGKRESADTGKLILGSIAWSQVARSVMAVAKDDDTGHLVISNTKANLAPGDTPSLSAVIREAMVAIEGDDPAEVGRVEWLGETEHDARDLLGGGQDEVQSELEEAAGWLRAYLEDPKQGGAAPAGEILKLAKRDGIAERTLQRARKKIGVTTNKGPNGWTWSLSAAEPSQGAKDDKDDTPDGKAPSEESATSEDAKAPTDMHARVPWRLGALAPCEGEPA